MQMFETLPLLHTTMLYWHTSCTTHANLKRGHISIYKSVHQFMLSSVNCGSRLAGVLLPQGGHISEAAAAAVGEVGRPQAQECGCAGRVR